jgi:hypothetical protein
MLLVSGAVFWISLPLPLAPGTWLVRQIWRRASLLVWNRCIRISAIQISAVIHIEPLGIAGGFRFII